MPDSFRGKPLCMDQFRVRGVMLFLSLTIFRCVTPVLTSLHMILPLRLCLGHAVYQWIAKILWL